MEQTSARRYAFPAISFLIALVALAAQLRGDTSNALGAVLYVVVVLFVVAGAWLLTWPVVKAHLVDWIDRELGDKLRGQLDRADSSPSDATRQAIGEEVKRQSEVVEGRAVAAVRTAVKNALVQERQSGGPHIPVDAGKPLRLAATKVGGELDYIDATIRHNASPYFMRGMRLPNTEFVSHGDTLAADASAAYKAVNAAYGVADVINIAASEKYEMEVLPTVDLNHKLLWNLAYKKACEALDAVDRERTSNPSD